MTRVHIDQLVKNIFVSKSEEGFKKESSSLQFIPIEFCDGRAIGVFCVDLLDQGFKRVEIPIGFTLNYSGVISKKTLNESNNFVDVAEDEELLMLNLCSCIYKQEIGNHDKEGKFTPDEGAPFFTCALDYAMAPPIPCGVYLIEGKRKLRTFYVFENKLLMYYNSSEKTPQEVELHYRKIKQLPLLESVEIIIPKQKITYASFVEQSFKKRHNPEITQEDKEQVKV
ncbi:hypothetical protein HY837_01915 [archaeon]|nr:hypothetical protein [archaeon]